VEVEEDIPKMGRLRKVTVPFDIIEPKALFT
jgi:hypothetical protein